MKTLLRNGKIYDGTGKEAFRGDVLVDGDRIAAVAPRLDAEADLEIDLTGKSVSAGFIDAHSHNDWFAVRKDPFPYFEPLLRQGITTYVCGNCGISAAGFEPDSPHLETLGSGLFGYENTTGRYGGVGSFFSAVDGNVPCNIVELAGHCTARASVAGLENRDLTPDEEARMLAILEKALQEGAAGLSLGLMYLPGVYAKTEELKKVAALCVKYGKPLTVHPRAESKVSMSYPLLGRAHILRALDELVEIARGTNLKLQYSHAIFVGRSSLKYEDEFLKIMAQLRADGVDAMFDIYNETLGVSVITVILPGWYQSLSPAARKSPLNRLKLGALVGATSRLLGFGFDDIQIAYIGPGYEKYEGRTVHQIARDEKTSDLDAYLMLCEKSQFRGRVNMGPYTTKKIISDFERHPDCLFITDAWVEEHGIQNPAIYDNHPKFLRDSLLGTGDTMPATVRKMTGAVADRFMIPRRGYVREGYFADLVVFDEEEIRGATPDQRKPFGICRVFVNGKQVLDGQAADRETLKTCGRAVPIL